MTLLLLQQSANESGQSEQTGTRPALRQRRSVIAVGVIPKNERHIGTAKELWDGCNNPKIYLAKTAVLKSPAMLQADG